MISQHGEKELKKFLDILNSYHPTIMFIANYSRDKTSYLDVEVIKKGNLFITVNLCKPTNSHQYLHALSCHIIRSKNQYLTAKPEAKQDLFRKFIFRQAR